jgi:predicted nuclease of restriction endonuclease-like (RecB) superfamily
MTGDILTGAYQELLDSLKDRIRNARVRAAISVNCELVLLYWQIGQAIIERQKQEGWSAKVIERLADDLRCEFPDMKGLSRANLFYMRAFAEAYRSEQIVQQLAGQLPWWHNVVI